MSGIPSESTHRAYLNTIPLLGFDLVASLPRKKTKGGSGWGKAQVDKLQFAAGTSKATPLLLLALATGRHIPTATLQLVKGGEGQRTFYRLKVDEVVVSDYESFGMTDFFEFAARTFALSYWPQDEKGGLGQHVTMTWDTSTGRALQLESPVPDPLLTPSP